MAIAGPTRTRQVNSFAGSLLKLARSRSKLTRRELAAAADVPQSTTAAIESGARQPSWPLLCRLLAAADLEPRVQLAQYDDHDDVLDATEASRNASGRTAADAAQQAFIEDLRASMNA